ncbi:MAG: hypothetical protein GY757_58585 [bacterium]|nr:hypothetical protein [bacterium]
MKIFLRTLITISILVVLAITFGCGGTETQTVKTEPTPVVKEAPTIEELRKPVDKDPNMFKVLKVIKKFGKFRKQYMTYEKYQKTSGSSGAIDPAWFYDSYDLEVNEKKHWSTVTYGSAGRAIERDPRIEKALEGLPKQSVIVKLKTPDGRKYIISDADGDGIIDFAKIANQKTVAGKQDIKVLDKMQEKYTWLMSIVKKYYKKNM